MTETFWEKRRHQREDVPVRIRYVLPDVPSETQVTSLSESGMFICTSRPESEGSALILDLDFPPEPEPLLLHARVARVVEPGGDYPPGMGVEFLYVDEKARERIRRRMRASGVSTILVNTSDSDIGELIGGLLRAKGHNVVGSRGLRDVSEAARKKSADLVVIELSEPEKQLDPLLPALRDLPAVFICSDPAPELQAKAYRRGIHAWLKRPFDPDVLRSEVDRIIKAKRLEREAAAVVDAKDACRRFLVCQSLKMGELVEKLNEVARVQQPALITGESGAGKEMVARAMHERSARRDRPFIVVDCTKLTPELMVSEVFGHEKGSYTGADRLRKGSVEQAGSGVVFLDEVADLDLECQAMLLRYLAGKTYERLGGEKLLESKAWILAATNKDINAMVESGEFREDLYYRLHVHRLHVPPLRERREDLPILVEILLGKLNDEYNKDVRHLSPEAERKIKTCDWPGNVRQLENSLRESILLLKGDTIHTINIVPAPRTGSPPSAPTAIILDYNKTWPENRRPLANFSEQYEKNYFEHLYFEYDCKATPAARHAGISRQQFNKKLKKLGIKTPK